MFGSNDDDDKGRGVDVDDDDDAPDEGTIVPGSELDVSDGGVPPLNDPFMRARDVRMMRGLELQSMGNI